ncbi:MAG: hypothetical protein ACRDU8_05725 [Egibacteraceae bacterium]
MLRISAAAAVSCPCPDSPWPGWGLFVVLPAALLVVGALLQAHRARRAERPPSDEHDRMASNG